jgi:diguanylate cyclase (GGDEF)-like protein
MDHVTDADPCRPRKRSSMNAGTPRPPGDDRAGAFARCRAGTTVRSACSGLVEDLYLRWELPSVYLLIDGRLRCQASRGYFQVSDGFTPSTGVIGRVVSSGTTEVIEDVTADPSFIAAIPGLRSEACIPLRVHGQVVGAVNLESRTTLDAAAVADIEAGALVLGERLTELGGLPEVALAERLARISVQLATQTEARAVEALAVEAAVEISGMSTAALVRRDGEAWSVLHADGPLSGVIRAWDDDVLVILGGWVWAGTSSYFPDGEDVPPGYEFLTHGIHALSVQPLVVAGRVEGLLITADTHPMAHDPARTTAMELLASQTAATLAMVHTMAALATQATQDPLTGLTNRRRLLECLQTAIEDRGLGGPRSALILLDLDGFKAVNDHHGHAEGDALLCAVARRLLACARDGDVVCRLGGDEFAVLVHGVTGAEHAAAVGRRLVAAVTEGSDGSGHPAVGASAGVRVITGGTTSSLLVDTDIALYAAKHAGRGSTVVWDASLRQEELEQDALVEDLRNALRCDELTLVYQPIVDIHTLQVRGLEALARWDHPERGAVSPAQFVAAAERAGLVGDLTRWVLRTACRQMVAWDSDLNVGLNVSAAQLTDDQIVEDVRKALAVSGMPATQVVLEVTETSAVADLPRAKRTLEALADLGVGLALDDFGTGYSSLTHAHTLPFDVLKVDQSFVAAAGTGDRRAIATIAAVCALASRLQVDVVAEGVESTDELPELIALGCSYAQGYALSRPMKAADVTAALMSSSRWTLGVPAPTGPGLVAVPSPRRAATRRAASGTG